MSLFSYFQKWTTQKSFDDIKTFSKSLLEAEMFISGSIMKMRMGDRDWEGDLELTARKIKAISKGLECKVKKIKESCQKKRRKQDPGKKTSTNRT